MTVLLVLMMFAIFLTIDFFYAKAKRPVLAVAPAKSKQAGTAPRLQPSLVGGFEVPDNLRYHPGHTWALSESPNLVRIGIDDFASKLTGKIEKIALPQRGQWIRQGQKVWSIVRNGVKVDMVSPIEGSVADINEAVVEQSRAGHQRLLRRRLAGNAYSRPTPRPTSATCWAAHWPAGGPKSPRCGCSASCPAPSAPWPRMAAWPSTMWPAP